MTYAKRIDEGLEIQANRLRDKIKRLASSHCNHERFSALASATESTLVLSEELDTLGMVDAAIQLRTLAGRIDDEAYKEANRTS